MFRNLLIQDPRYGFPTALFIIVLIWLFFWKGYALWRAAKNDQKYWFTAMLILSTLGILEIVYLFVFQRQKGTLYLKLAQFKERLIKKTPPKKSS